MIKTLPSSMGSSVSEALSKDEKKALGIVVTGNFLEYFDLMLFSHLAFIVVPYFTPKTDPLVAKLLGILTFSSSFVIRPFAAYFWGYIGDHFGRVIVLSYTTMIMAVTCLLIPNIPSYAEWGIYSTLVIIGCRILQGFSSAGEAKGAEIFVAEIVPRFPKIFTVSALVPITCDLGGLLATILGSLCLAFSEDGWKHCFYIGAAIAFCSTISRKKLRETKEFIEHSVSKKKNLKTAAELKIERETERRNFYALLGLNMIGPTAFYFAFSFCNDLLKNDIGLSSSMILLNSSMLLVCEMVFIYTCARLAYHYNPFEILKVRTFSSFILFPMCFITLLIVKTHLTIFLTQLVVLLLTASFDPATPIIIRSFGIQNRFTQYSKAWAFAKAIMYFSTGYLTFYLDKFFGMWGVLGLMLFFSGIFCISLYTFITPDKRLDDYYSQNHRRKRRGVSFASSSLEPSALDNTSNLSTDDTINNRAIAVKHQKTLKRWLEK
ncbi:MAG TPA: hypothetical protein VNJ29_03025 [Candidatus Nitrosotenuis sp.]|jgi:MFS family permease|nr:hypothetical protein [Candidatus Nitrosotenuis sp.]